MGNLLDPKTNRFKAAIGAAGFLAVVLLVSLFASLSSDETISLGDEAVEDLRLRVETESNLSATPTTLTDPELDLDSSTQLTTPFAGVNLAANITNEPNIEPDAGQDGSVRVVCHASHFGFDDPIVFPGEVGGSHLHMFFGNTLTDANSTYNSLASSGDGTCQGGPLNRTAYWVPTLHDGDDLVRVPQYSLIYYKSGPLHGQEIQEFPEGLRMITGNARAQNTNQQSGTKYSWYCGSPITGGGRANSGDLIPDCQPGQFVSLQLDFPNCWDGVNLDSADHSSHVAHSQGNACPTTHPVPLPQVTYNLYWNNNDVNTGDWYLSSDHEGDLRLPGGTTTHADWFGAWHPDVLETFVDECNNADHDCKGGTISPQQKLSSQSSPWFGGASYEIFSTNQPPLKFSVAQLTSDS